MTQEQIDNFIKKRDGLWSSLSYLVNHFREICDHKYPNGESAKKLLFHDGSTDCVICRTKHFVLIDKKEKTLV